MTKKLRVIYILLIGVILLTACSQSQEYPRVDPDIMHKYHTVGDDWFDLHQWEPDEFNKQNGYSCLIKYRLLEFTEDYFVLSFSNVYSELDKPADILYRIDVTDFVKVESMTDYVLPPIYEDGYGMFFANYYIDIVGVEEEIILKFYFANPIDYERFEPYIMIMNLRASAAYCPSIKICPEIYVKEIETE